MRYSFITLCAVAALSLSGCMTVSKMSPFSWNTVTSPSSGTFKVGNPYTIGGVRYTPEETYNFTQKGIASWYGPNFDGKLTANGEIYDQRALTAAHKTLQMPSIVRVTNLENGRSIIVRVNDRGPFSRGRIIDMSERGAELLQFKNQGTAKVKVQVMPLESQLVAEAAKKGQDVRGVEIALNQGKSIYEFLGLAEEGQLNAVAQVEPSPQETIAPKPLEASDMPAAQQKVMPVTEAQSQQDRQSEVAPPSTAAASNRSFLDVLSDTTGKDITPPAATPAQPISTATQDVSAKTDVPVAAADNKIFIQAGSFGSADNAAKYAEKLKLFGDSHVKEVSINGRSFYRVRVGPIDSVESADKVLNRMSESGEINAIITLGE